MAFCHKCGTKSEDGARFCCTCGTKLMDLGGSGQPETSNSTNYIVIDNMKNMLGFWQPLPDYRSVLNQFQYNPNITGEKDIADKLISIAKHYQEIDKLRTTIGGVNVGTGAGFGVAAASPQGSAPQGGGIGYGGAAAAVAGGAMVGMMAGQAMAGPNTAYAAQPGMQPGMAPAPVVPAASDGGGGFVFISGDAAHNISEGISDAGNAAVDTVSEAASDLADVGSEVADGASDLISDILDLF